MTSSNTPVKRASRPLETLEASLTNRMRTSHMKISRQKYLLASSALLTTLLTGCGGPDQPATELVAVLKRDASKGRPH